MPQSCIICNHINKVEIDRQIVKRHNLAQLAREFGVPYDSLARHAKTHVSRQMVQAIEKQGLIEGMNLLQTVDDILTTSKDILQRNYDQGRDVVALKAVDSIRNVIDLLAKVSYQLHQAKMADIELQRLERRDDLTESAEDFQKKISERLTPSEIATFERLMKKIMKT